MAIHQLALTSISDFFPSSEVATMQQTDGAAYKLKLRSFYKSTHLWAHFVDFHPSVNCTWQYYQTPKSAVVFEQFCLLNPLSQFLSAIQLVSHTSKVQIASSHYNSSTPVPLLETPFNTILCLSDQMAYPPNTLWHSRQIHQRDHSSLRSPSSTIQPGQTISPVSGPSIVSADNDPNWKNAPTNPITNTTIANRPTSFTRSQSKLHWSNNTNEQLAKVLSWLVNILNSNQTPNSNTNTRGTKAYIPDTFSSTEPNKLNNFLFQCRLYFHANLA